MYLQALLIRAAVAIATGLMLTAAILIDHTGHASPATAPVAAVAEHSRSAMSAPVTLPTIHVRPTAADLASASAPQNHGAVSVINAALPDLAAPSTPSLRGLDVDMPYYSFGRVLPRIGSKE
ncbi:MAG: hypothetical protein KGI64_03150 [Xanthomonadaceae bacterium]|nr:hypothetical protein [Xanthomonadaceae bacterium]MDE1960800.1 hypothetical protein [Xanthomonadaceae bacterium]MDE2083840.1 hypothetical protein [Xanthomonadaceae bacterium]MDE2256315.1 hypothetical protein [Xanthomonadaceae bacterium]